MLNSAQALPLREGARKFTPNQNYGSECFDPTVTMPTGKSVMDMTVLNCNTIQEPYKFCQCVEKMAEAMDFQDPIQQFKDFFIKDKVLNNARNLNIGLNLKFRDALMSELIKGHEMDEARNSDSCNLFYEGKVDPEREPLKAAVHEKMLTDIVSYVDNREQTESDSDRKHTRDEILTEQLALEEGVESIKKARRIRKRSNNKAIYAMIKYAATRNYGDGRSLAAEFIQPTSGWGGFFNEGAKSAFKGMLGFEDEHGVAVAKRSNIFNQIREEMSADPNVRDSILGVEDSFERSQDINAVFSKVLQDAFSHLKATGYDFTKPIEDPAQLAGLDERNLKHLLGEQLDESFLNGTQKQCNALNEEYHKYLRSFTETGFSRDGVTGLREAEFEYDRFFSEAAAHSPKRAEWIYRKLEKDLLDNNNTFPVEDPNKMMVLLDIHYCQKEPTKPREPMSSLEMAALTPSAVRATASAQGAYYDSDEKRRELAKDLRRTHGFQREYKAAVESYNGLSFKIAEIEANIEKTKKDIEEEEKRGAASADVVATLKAKLTELENDLNQTRQAATQAQQVAEEAFAKYKAADSEAYYKHGEAYLAVQRWANGNAVDESGCSNQFIRQGERWVPNPNWHADSAKCMLAIQEKLKEEYNLDFESDDYSDVMPPTYYSTDAETNRNYSAIRTTIRNANYETTISSSADDLRERFEKSQEQFDPTAVIRGPVSVGDRQGKDNTEEPLIPKATAPADPFQSLKEGEIAADNLDSSSTSKPEDSPADAAEDAKDKKKDAKISEREEDDRRKNEKNNEEREERNKAISEKFAQIKDTIDKYSGPNAAGVEFSDERQAELARIQREAREVEEREAALLEGEQNYNEGVAASEKASSDPNKPKDPLYDGLLAEIDSLRNANEKLQGEVDQISGKRKKTGPSKVSANAAIAASSGPAASAQDPSVTSVNGDSTNRQPASFGNAQVIASGAGGTSSATGGRVVNASTAPRTLSSGQDRHSALRSAGEEALPAPLSRGGELQDATVALNKDIDASAVALPILSGIGKSQEILTGSYGFERFLTLVGSSNELSLEDFNEIRLNPAKYGDLKIDNNQPIIVRTSEGHMVMLPVMKGDTITGFRYVKEIRPEHVDRRIASEKSQIAELKARLIRDADLDALIEANTKK